MTETPLHKTAARNLNEDDLEWAAVTDDHHHFVLSYDQETAHRAFDAFSQAFWCMKSLATSTTDEDYG